MCPCTGLSAEFLQRLIPRTLGIQAQLADGDILTDDDAAFLADMLDTLGAGDELFEHHRGIEAPHRCALSLHDDIMTRRFANEAARFAANC